MHFWSTVRHRFSQHFTLLSNYTWSHCIGNGDDQGELETSNFKTQEPTGDRGNCSADRRQIFNTFARRNQPNLQSSSGPSAFWATGSSLRLSASLPARRLLFTPASTIL